MNAINSDPMFERLDSAALAVRYALTIIEHAQSGPADVDLYGCTMNEAEKALKLAATDLKAAGATF